MNEEQTRIESEHLRVLLTETEEKLFISEEKRKELTVKMKFLMRTLEAWIKQENGHLD